MNPWRSAFTAIRRLKSYIESFYFPSMDEAVIHAWMYIYTRLQVSTPTWDINVIEKSLVCVLDELLHIKTSG